MPDTKHTPGPWVVRDLKKGEYAIDAACWSELATVYATGDPLGQEQGTANAHLIAAAQDLLAACELADVSMDTAAMMGVGDILPPEYRGSWVRAHRALQAAVAKAKGGTA